MPYSIWLVVISLSSFFLITILSCGKDKNISEIQWKATKERGRKNGLHYKGFHHDAKDISRHKDISSLVKANSTFVSRIRLFSYHSMENEDTRIDGLYIDVRTSEKKLRPIVNLI